MSAAPARLLSAARLEKGVEALAARHGAASDRPSLREDVIIRRLVQLGEVMWVVKNTETNKVYTFDDPTWELIRYYDGTRTRTQILESYNAGFPPGEGIPFQHVLDLEESLRTEKLLVRSEAERSFDFLKSSRRRAADNKAEGINPLYMLYHVLDPDRFLDRTVKWVRWLWTPPAVAVACVFFAMTIGVFGEHFATIWQETVETYAFLRKPFWDAVQFFAIFTSIGCVHEFAHAYVTKIYGGQVHDIGLALMYFAPAFYCDTSDSLLFESKWQRLWVTLAGIYIEALMCTVATGLWIASYPDTLLHELAYKTMLYTGVSTVFFNINPLIKIDGYWALTDLLGMPNLREDAFAYLGAWIQRKVLRLNAPLEPVSRRRRRIYIVYAFLAAIYAGFIMWFIGGLFFNFYSTFLPQFALILCLVTMAKIFKNRVNAVVRVAKLFYLDKKELLMSRRTNPPILLAAAALLLVAAVPWSRRSIESRIRLQPARTVQLQAPEEAVVAEVNAREGDLLREKDVVFVLASPRVESRAAAFASVSARLSKEAEGLRGAGDARGTFRAESERTAADAGLRSEEAARDRLSLRSPAAGTLLTPRVQDLLGRHVRGGTVLAEVGDCRTLRAEIHVTERLLTDLAVGAEVWAHLAARPSKVVRGHLVSIAPATLSVARSGAHEKEGLRPPERPEQFVAVAEFDNAAGLLLPRMSGVAKIYGNRASYLSRAFRIFRRWVQTIVW